MADKRLPQLNAYTTVQDDDLLMILDTDNDETKKMESSYFKDYVLFDLGNVDNTADADKPISTATQTALNGRNPYHGVVTRPVGASNPLPTHNTGTVFTLNSATNNIAYYYQGKHVNVTNDKTCSLGTAGLKFLYFLTDTGEIEAGNFPGIDESSNVIIANVIWNGTNYALINDERHSYTRNKKWHEWAHNTVGVRYRSGITLTHNGGTGAAATFATTAGEIADEDIKFVVNASSAFPTANACRLFWQTAAAVYDFDKTTSTVPFKRGANNRPVYVRSDTYAVVEMNSATNRYINVFVYVTDDLHTPIYMFTETVSPTIAGTNGHSNVSNARAIPFPNLSGINIAPELKPIYRLIIRADGQVQAIDTTLDDYRTVSSLPASAGLSSVTASAVAFNPYNSLTTSNVQSAIEMLYDMIQGL